MRHREPLLSNSPSFMLSCAFNFEGWGKETKWKLVASIPWPYMWRLHLEWWLRDFFIKRWFNWSSKFNWIKTKKVIKLALLSFLLQKYLVSKNKYSAEISAVNSNKKISTTLIYKKLPQILQNLIFWENIVGKKHIEYFPINFAAFLKNIIIGTLTIWSSANFSFPWSYRPWDGLVPLLIVTFNKITEK
jgi:hypothetical protein